MKKALAYVASPEVQIGIALPLAAWFLYAVLLLDLPPETAAGTAPVTAFSAVLAMMAGLSAIACLRSRAVAAASIWFGIALLPLQLVALSALRFQGTISIGEGETAPQYTAVEAGLLAGVPSIPIRLLQTQVLSAASATIAVDAQVRHVAPGQSVHWNGYQLKLTAVSDAPLFILNDLKGRELDAGYIKLRMSDGEPSFFQFPVMPHRIYVEPANRRGEAWKRDGKVWKHVPSRRDEGAADADPEALRITITRGKLRIASAVVRPGKPLQFHQYSVRFEKGVPWAELEVKKQPSLVLLVVGAALIVLGAVTRRFARRSA